MPSLGPPPYLSPWHCFKPPLLLPHLPQPSPPELHLSYLWSVVESTQFPGWTPRGPATGERAHLHLQASAGSFPNKLCPFSLSLIIPFSTPLFDPHFHFALEGFSSFSANQRKDSFLQNPSPTSTYLTKVLLTLLHRAHHFNYSKMAVSRREGP